MPLIEAEAQNEHIVFEAGCHSSSLLSVNHTITFSRSSSSTVECLRSLSASRVASLFPPRWNMPGIWSLPQHPSGQHFEGIAIVDGVTIAKSFISSLSLAMIDVPLMFGQMAQEPDEYPGDDVSGLTSEEWQAMLNETFAPWGDDVGMTIWSLYAEESDPDPQRGYDAIVTDYGLTCAAVQLSRAAYSLGARQSPTYVFLNTWGLASPYLVSSDYFSRYPHHVVDWWMVTEQWSVIGDGSYAPQSSDTNGTLFLQNLWYNFMTKRTPGDGFLPVSSLPGWPDVYNFYRISYPQSFSVPNLKSGVCTYFTQIGIDRPQFWWAN